MRKEDITLIEQTLARGDRVEIIPKEAGGYKILRVRRDQLREVTAGGEKRRSAQP